MHLFENEVINITGIRTVNMYDTAKEFGNKNIRYYAVNLTSYELVFFISGEGKTHFSGTDIHDMPDSLRYMPKGITKGEYCVEKSVEGVCIDIYFDTTDPMPQIAVGLSNMKELKPLFVKIYNVWNSKKNGFYAECMSILYEIIAKIKKHNQKYFTGIQGKKIIESHNYMLKHFCDRGFDYKAMCSKSGLSYDYFKELFIKEYGVSPVKYVTQLRVERAKELLITGRYTVTETAYMCGFENVYYFSTVFKKHVGVSPKKYNVLK